MRLNALHPEDNPMETLLYCFGGDDGGGDSAGADTQDAQMDELDAISEQFDAMDRAYERGDTFATSGDTDYVSVDSSGNVTDSSYSRDADIVVTVPNTPDTFNASNYLNANPDVAAAVARGETTAEQHYSQYGQYEGRSLGNPTQVTASSGTTSGTTVNVPEEFDMPPEDQSMTAGYPTEELTAGIGDTVVSALLGEEGVEPEQISDIYSSLLNTAQKTEALYGPAQPSYVETDIYGYDYPDYTPTVDIGDTSVYDPGFSDDDTGDTGISDFISKAFEQDNLAVKNNNPGNLKYAGQPGATEDAQGFAKFEDPEAGMNALVNQINLDRSRGDTLEEFISAYAPPSENATQNYLDYVSQRTGIAPGEQIPEDKVDSVADAITQMEGGDLSTDYFSSAQDIYDTMREDMDAGITVEFVDEGTDYRDTFVAQDRIGQGIPVTALPEGSYKLDPETSTVAMNDLGREYMDALKKGINNEPNPYGIDRQEIESLMAQGEVVGSPVVQISSSQIGSGGAQAGAEAPAGEGEDEAGLAGGMGGAGRLGDADVTQEGVDNDFAYELPAYFPSETGDYAQVETRTSGLGISPDEGGVGIMPEEGGIVGTDTGLVGQSGSGSINPFTEGGAEGESDAPSVMTGPGEDDFGTGPGAGDGLGTGTPSEVADSGDGGETPAPPVIPEEPSEPYSFGDVLTYDPDLPPFDYRTPLTTQAYDFMRDFGAYTLSEPIAERFAERALLAPEGLTPYTPEYMEPISEMDLARQEELLALIGERFPGEFGEFTYDTSLSPLESAEALIASLNNDQ